MFNCIGGIAFLRQYSSFVICVRCMTHIDILSSNYRKSDVYGFVEGCGLKGQYRLNIKPEN